MKFDRLLVLLACKTILESGLRTDRCAGQQRSIHCKIMITLPLAALLYLLMRWLGLGAEEWEWNRKDLLRGNSRMNIRNCLLHYNQSDKSLIAYIELQLPTVSSHSDFQCWCNCNTLVNNFALYFARVLLHHVITELS